MTGGGTVVGSLKKYLRSTKYLRLMAVFVGLITVLACDTDEPSVREGSIIYGQVTRPQVITGVPITKNLTLEMRVPDATDPAIGPGPYPALIFIHGGFWVQGNWDDFEGAIQSAADRGYVAVSINYRLLNFNIPLPASLQQNEWPAAMEDTNCAVRWLNAHAAEYNIQTETVNGQERAVIGAVGHSAGAANALLLAQATNLPAFVGDCVFDGLPDTTGFSSHVAAVSALSPPVDLVNIFEPLTDEKFGLAFVFGGGLPSVVGSDRYLQASALSYVDQGDTPIMLLHGELDEWIPSSHLDNYASLLAVQNRRLVYARYPENGHNWVFSAEEIQPNNHNWLDAFNKTLDFMDEILKGEASTYSCDARCSLVYNQ